MKARRTLVAYVGLVIARVHQRLALTHASDKPLVSASLLTWHG